MTILEFRLNFQSTDYRQGEYSLIADPLPLAKEKYFYWMMALVSVLIAVQRFYAMHC